MYLIWLETIDYHLRKSFALGWICSHLSYVAGLCAADLGDEEQFCLQVTHGSGIVSAALPFCGALSLTGVHPVLQLRNDRVGAMSRLESGLVHLARRGHKCPN